MASTVENGQVIVMYQFVGGPLNGQMFERWQLDDLVTGTSYDWSAERAAGRLVPREELDNQPTFDGYVGPMWDGYRFIGIDGKLHYDFERSRFLARPGHPDYLVIRYETQEVYDMLSR